MSSGEREVQGRVEETEMKVKEDALEKEE